MGIKPTTVALHSHTCAPALRQPQKNSSSLQPRHAGATNMPNIEHYFLHEFNTKKKYHKLEHKKKSLKNKKKARKSQIK